MRPREWGLFAASSAVLLVGVVLTVAVWIALTWLLRHHWPWNQKLERGGSTVTSQLDVTKVALSVVAGVGAAIALTVTYRRQRDIERARFDERLAAGAAQLGANSAAQRLAGVYTIAALADETTARRQQCIDLLCAYLRLDYDPTGGLLRSVTSEHTWSIGTATGREERTYERLPNDRDVRAAIVDAIRTRLQAGGPWVGSDFNFAGAVFDGANFDGVHFSSGTAYFDRARFVGGNVSFDGAQFTGAGVYFNHAQFVGATVYFNDSCFASGTVRFSDAHFIKGRIHFDSVKIVSGNVNFKRVAFAGAEVSFRNAQYMAGNMFFTDATFTDGAVRFGSTGQPSSAAASRSAISFAGAVGAPGIVVLGDLKTQVHQVIGSDGQDLVGPEVFS